MNTNCIAHYLPEYRTGSVSMMMADVAELIPEFRHVCLEKDSVESTDPDLNMYLLSKGVTTHYGGEALKDVAVELFYHSSGIEISGPSGYYFSIHMKNVPMYEKYNKIRNQTRGNMKFHIGLLFGERGMHPQFLEQMAQAQPKDSTLFVTTMGVPRTMILPLVYDTLFKDEKAFACPYNAGVVPKYLEWLDVAVMPEDRISDRLQLEIEAAGIPVLTGDIETILTQINDIRNNRELYKQYRRQALLHASGNDMAYEIIKLKTHIGRAMSWSISNLQSGQEFLPTLTQAEGSI